MSFEAVFGMVQIKSVGVIGAGQMGSGIAHVCALAGYDVLLHDVSEDKIAAGLSLMLLQMVILPPIRG